MASAAGKSREAISTPDFYEISAACATSAYQGGIVRGSLIRDRFKQTDFLSVVGSKQSPKLLS